MHGLGASALAGVDDLVGDEVGLAGGSRTEQHGFVGQPDMAGVGIGLGIDSNSADAHAARGLDDTASDLASICDQDLVEHGLFLNPVGLTFVVSAARRGSLNIRCAHVSLH